MFNIRVADIVIEIDNKYKYIEKMCRDYITDEPAVFSVSVTDEEIMFEDMENQNFPPQYLETLAIYRKITAKASGFGIFLMHGVLMDVDGHGLLLCAESGTGKTTHSNLWRELLGERLRIINGDKPLIRLCDGTPYGYGTPWCGKEQINENDRTRLYDICFIKRAKENSTKELQRSEVIANLLPAVHIPDGAGAGQVLETLDAVSKNIRFWEISCNMDISAAETAYKAIMAIGK